MPPCICKNLPHRKGNNQQKEEATEWEEIFEMHVSYKAGVPKFQDLIPGLGRSPGEGNSYPLHYSCLENHMDIGAWRATAMGSQRVGHD